MEAHVEHRRCRSQEVSDQQGALIEALERREMLASDAGIAEASSRVAFEAASQHVVQGSMASWLPDDWFDDNVETPRPVGAARQYSLLITRIQKRKLSPEDLELLETVIKDRAEYEQAAATMVLILNGGGNQAAYDRLYRRIIEATPNPAVLYDTVRFQLDDIMRYGKSRPDKASARYAWPGASMLLSAMHGYEASGQVRFLDVFVEAFDEMLASRSWQMQRTEDHRDRRMKTWHADVGDIGWTAFITYVGRLGYPVGLFAEAVKSEPKLRSVYGAKASRYVAAIEESLAEFEEDYRVIDKGRAGYYLRGAMGDVEPLNHLHTVGNTLVLLHAVTGKNKYRTRAEQLANYFKSALRVETNGTYTWGYQPTPENRTDHPPEMIYKGEVTAQFPVVAQQYGIGFTKKDLRVFAQSYLRNIYDKSGNFNMWVGTEPYRTDAPGAKRLRDRLTSVVGWMVYDGVEPTVTYAAENTLFRRPDLFPDAWLTDVKTIEMYAHRMTREMVGKRVEPGTGGPVNPFGRERIRG